MLFDLLPKLLEKLKPMTEEESEAETKRSIYKKFEQSEVVRFMWSTSPKPRNWWKSDVFKENYRQLCQRHKQRLKTPAERALEDMEQM